MPYFVSVFTVGPLGRAAYRTARRKYGAKHFYVTVLLVVHAILQFWHHGQTVNLDRYGGDLGREGAHCHS